MKNSIFLLVLSGSLIFAGCQKSGNENQSNTEATTAEEGDVGSNLDPNFGGTATDTTSTDSTALDGTMGEGTGVGLENKQE